MTSLGILPHCDSWMTSHSPEFSRALAAEGWIGMTLPRAYGGHGRSFVERYVVNEELLAAGAPIAAHWFADRQVGPAILRHGTEEQRQRFLPAIAAGELFVAIGMSEPDSGSDLAAVRTRATRQADGWVLDGAKVWTSHAHRAHYVLVLARTAPVTEGRHAGLTQFLVDLNAPGVQVNPIRTMNGRHHFNEVVFEEVQLGEDAVIGTPGQGWAQVTAELAFERSGPERFLSTLPLLRAVLAEPTGTVRDHASLGRALASLMALRRLSRQVAEQLQQGELPVVRAALVKDLGTQFEGTLIDVVRSLEPDASRRTEEVRRLMEEALIHAPDRTLRGGTNEVLRGIVAKSLAAR